MADNKVPIDLYSFDVLKYGANLDTNFIFYIGNSVKMKITYIDDCVMDDSKVILMLRDPDGEQVDIESSGREGYKFIFDLGFSLTKVGEYKGQLKFVDSTGKFTSPIFRFLGKERLFY